MSAAVLAKSREIEVDKGGIKNFKKNDFFWYDNLSYHPFFTKNDKKIRFLSNYLHANNAINNTPI